MAFSRYLNVPRLIRGTVSMSTVGAAIRSQVVTNNLAVDTLVLEEGQRLDQIAAERYGDGQYWWVLAAASGIGWGLQVPPGTIIKIPNSLEEILSIL